MPSCHPHGEVFSAQSEGVRLFELLGGCRLSPNSEIWNRPRPRPRRRARPRCRGWPRFGGQVLS